MKVFIGVYRAAERGEIRRKSRSIPDERVLKGKTLKELDMNAFSEVGTLKMQGHRNVCIKNSRGFQRYSSVCILED
jgi:hypothetical protein